MPSASKGGVLKGSETMNILLTRMKYCGVLIGCTGNSKMNSENMPKDQKNMMADIIFWGKPLPSKDDMLADILGSLERPRNTPNSKLFKRVNLLNTVI